MSEFIEYSLLGLLSGGVMALIALSFVALCVDGQSRNLRPTLRRLTDQLGHVADFRHTIIILTTNLGATAHRGSGLGFGTVAADTFSSEQILGAIGQAFRPEFQNRLDKVIVFHPLTRDLMRGISCKNNSAVNETLHAPTLKPINRNPLQFKISMTNHVGNTRPHDMRLFFMFRICCRQQLQIDSPNIVRLFMQQSR